MHDYVMHKNRVPPLFNVHEESRASAQIRTIYRKSIFPREILVRYFIASVLYTGYDCKAGRLRAYSRVTLIKFSQGQRADGRLTARAGNGHSGSTRDRGELSRLYTYVRSIRTVTNLR